MCLEDKIIDIRTKRCAMNTKIAEEGEYQNKEENILYCNSEYYCPLQIDYKLKKPVCGSSIYYQMLDKVEL